ncbi:MULTISPECIES: NAD(P)-binding protein [unclassified Pseudomonas]|uniref:NAD(P)-binding protein n=1 Tax=unclassified Pseudomonas TaxID=196821 RepID=UPI002448EE2C|nr:MULTISPECIES: NAD(P)-binding protein [unclassified Pseudomonas]MDG9924778.1 NAD(P)-binding protein [Pseudomonas sp. GD04045]MDH0036759.1 NAD(P)-binding protein [Pseudomonas sp. GD04019]
MPSAVIVGASIGGLVAAAQLREAGWDVTLLEKGQSVGGLYATVDTPFGTCELGMHVLYVSAEQQALLTAMFGSEVFIEKRGVQVDIGASFNAGVLNPNSIYPDVRHLPELPLIREQVLQRSEHTAQASVAEESRARFGAVAAEQVIAPILEKLWKQPAQTLTSGALHCFFDLRRIILADKPQADALKQEPRLDAVIGNPEQTHPAGEVYGGRRALFFTAAAHDLSDRAVNYLRGEGICVELGCDVRLDDDMLVRDGKPLSAEFDACIIASPLAALAPDVAQQLDSVELSIFYFQIEPLELPAYYVLCHDSGLAASRIVNYRAYNFDQAPHLDRVLAVEAVHEVGQPPSIERLVAELQQVLPGVRVLDSHGLSRRLRVAVPSLANAARLDDLAQRVSERSGFTLLHFTGMRTDKGLFFSHQTVGAAYAAALDCSQRLP